MINKIRKLIGREEHLKKADLQRLKMLASDDREPALFSVLYELAFQNAVTFAHDEMKRPESPFRGLQRDHFFNEILIMNFWMMDKVFSKLRKDLAEKMHHHYFGSLADIADRSAALAPKLRAYSLCWDDYTGHHDEFGLRVGEALFGKDSGFPEKVVSFWIISYADESIKKYKKVRKALREADIV